MVSHIRTTPPVEPYFNHSVGQYVTSHKDFENKLRIGAAEQSERLGLDHKYSVMSPDDSRRQAESVASLDGGVAMEKALRTYSPPSTTRIIT